MACLPEPDRMLLSITCVLEICPRLRYRSYAPFPPPAPQLWGVTKASLAGLASTYCTGRHLPRLGGKNIVWPARTKTPEYRSGDFTRRDDPAQRTRLRASLRIYSSP